jgi:hypothetical protein
MIVRPDLVVIADASLIQDPAAHPYLTSDTRHPIPFSSLKACGACHLEYKVNANS